MHPPTKTVDVYIPRRAGRLWSYLTTDTLVPGQLVVAPFGRSRELAVVAGTDTAPDVDIDRLRTLQGISPWRALTDDTWQTLLWAERYTLASKGALLDKLLSLGGWEIGRDAAEGWSIAPATPPRSNLFAAVSAPALRSAQAKAAWARVAELPAFEPEALADLYRDPRAVLRRWEAGGHIRRCEDDLPTAAPQPAELTPAQRRIADAIVAAPGAHLIEGITGSGKTEIYIELARATLAAGRNVLVLVPEIALASEVQTKFQRRLGRPAGLWHSALAAGQRAAVLNRLVHDTERILVGARSALFAPLNNVGLIVVDEEHDSGYQLVGRVTVNIRDAAVQRARLTGATVVLGSATPSLEISRRAREHGDISRHVLNQRANQAALPDVQLVDTGHAQERGPQPWLSRSLLAALETTLERGEQAILFRNRRGFHPVVICNACHEPVECPNCSVTLTVHSRPVELRCHVCGYHRAPPKRCEQCGSTRLAPLGTGTQRIASELETLLPGARIDRLDRDQTTSATRLDGVLERLRSGETDILVGTQMVTKGLDVSNVTLVGVVNIDGLLHQPDYRASERSFQHLCQVAGRAGRGDKAGRVLIQTAHPEHPVIRAALEQSYEAFYTHEIRQRELAGYPPFTRIVRLLWSGRDQRAVQQIARSAVGAAGAEGVTVLGPGPAAIERINRAWRWQAIAKSSDVHALRQWAVAARSSRSADGIDCELHVDPYGLL